MVTPVRIKIRGVRAIHSCPDRNNLTTGGNTSSLEFHDGVHRIFINAGFGINLAGDEIFAKYLQDKIPVNCTILFSDFLWDSMLGLPFFTPIHFKSTELDILTGASEQDARSAIDDAASNLFSPFQGADGFRASITIRQINSPMNLGPWTIDALSIPHPLTPYPVTIWRIKHESGVDVGVVMLCDNDQALLTKVQTFLQGCQTLFCAATSSWPGDPWARHRTNFDDAMMLAQKIGADDLHLIQFHPEMTDHLLQAELARLQAKLLPIKKDHKRPERSPSPLQIRLGNEVDEIVPAAPLLTIGTSKKATKKAG